MTRKTLTPTAAALMQEAIQHSPHSRDDLVRISGLAKPVVARYVRELRNAEPRMIHIGGWARDARGYPTIECYSWGNQPDVLCPKKYADDAERMRVSRAEKGGA